MPASAAAVWSSIVEKESYEQWTSIFLPGSTFEGEWRKGSEIRFLGPADASGASGLLARVSECEYPKFISLDILAEVRDGKVMNAAEPWQGAYERYRLHPISDELTRFELDMMTFEEHYDAMSEGWDNALEILSELAQARHEAPARLSACVWHNGTAREAFQHYAGLFPNAWIPGEIDADPSAAQPTVITMKLGALELMGLNGGPQYRPTPSISIFVRSGNARELRRFWDSLSQNSIRILIPFEEQQWSPLYGWLEDEWGLSWQLMLSPAMTEDELPIFTPAMLFTGAQFGKAEQALRLYESIIPGADLSDLNVHEEGDLKGTVLFAEMQVPGLSLIAMDGPGEHAFGFDPGLSLVLHCKDQEEIDHVWQVLLKSGGEENRCGWIVDGFGVSWQILPIGMGAWMRNPVHGPARMKALMDMVKLDVALLSSTEL